MNSWDSRLTALLEHVHIITNLQHLGALADWDQQVNLPIGSSESRANQMETLSIVLHQLETSEKYQKLLENALQISYPEDSDEHALLRTIKKNFDKAKSVPERLNANLARQQSITMSAWEASRKQNDFSFVSDALKDLISLKQEYAACFPAFSDPYDAMLDDFEEGFTYEKLKPIMDEMKQKLPPLVEKICISQKNTTSFLSLHYDEDKQIEVAKKIMSNMGYDFNHGRVDCSVHPFTVTFDIDDVRVTTRTRPNELTNCLFSCMHECGHALYEQHILSKYSGTPLATGASYSFHESQSRFWENIVGHSNAFWRKNFYELQKAYPEQLGKVSSEEFTSAVNHVEKTFIRTESDEVTYNLHILMRIELETALIHGELSCRDLPDAWNQKFHSYFGKIPPSLKEGVLQDSHWYSGAFAYFPSYMLGNLIGSMLVENLFPQGIPTEPLEIVRTLSDSLYQFGAKYSPACLLQKLTGTECVSCKPFLRYIENKYLKGLS